MKVHPWERQAGETQPAYEAFAIYRDLGVKRSLTEVSRRCSKNVSLMRRWSAQHSWVERARAWEAEQDRAWRAEQTEARREVGRKHLRVGAAMLGKVVQRLQSLDADKLSPSDLERWARTATMMEQQAIGGLDDEAESGIRAAAGMITELVRQVRGQP